MKIPYFLLTIAAMMTMVFTSACSDDTPGDSDGALPLIVEGWIEDGEHPMVIVTRAVDLTQDLENLDDCVEKWCKVIVDDGTRREVLVGKVDKAYLPSLVFTSTHITGRVGATYRLTVQTQTDSVWAETTIPPYVPIDSVRVTPCLTNDTLYQVTAFPAISPSDGGYYKFFVRVRGSEPRYYSAFLGTFEAAAYSPANGYNVQRGRHFSNSGEMKYSPYYCAGDTVMIKLCSLGCEEFNFWSAYESAVSMSSNMFFSVTSGCPSNVVGAKGYWAGYGTSYYQAVIRP